MVAVITFTTVKIEVIGNAVTWGNNMKNSKKKKNYNNKNVKLIKNFRIFPHLMN